MTYKKLLQYAKRINKNNYEDLAHEYLIRSYERGRDVLDETKFNCSYVWMGLKGLNINMRNRDELLISRPGEDRKRQFHTINKVGLDYDNMPVAYNAGPAMVTLSLLNKHVEGIANSTKSPDTYLKVFDLYPQGYKEKEMSEIIGLSQQNLNRRRQKIQSWIKEWK